METMTKSRSTLCQEVEMELRELCLECRKKFPSIKEHMERAILQVRHHRDILEQDGRNGEDRDLPEFPSDEVLHALLMGCETFQTRIVSLSFSCLQRLIHRQVLKDATMPVVINLMKEQATHGDESVQLKALQTIMATPSHMTLLNELVVEQLMQLLHMLHSSTNASVHHTACACLRQLAEHLTDRAAAAAADLPRDKGSLGGVRAVIQRTTTAVPVVTPSPAPTTLCGPVRMLFLFVQDLCVMADYDISGLHSRYSVDAGERMRTGSREGFWLATIKFPRPLCLELLGTCVGAQPKVFISGPQCFALLRQQICAVLMKNLKGCFDFAIMIRSLHLLQQVLRCPDVAVSLMPEVHAFLHLMLEMATAEKSPWQRATSLEFLKSVCEDPAILAVLYEKDATIQSGQQGTLIFLNLVNSLSKLMHQVCFSVGMEAGTFPQTGPSLVSNAAGGSAIQRTASMDAPGLVLGRGPGSFLGGGSNLLGAGSLLGGASLPSFGLGSSSSNNSQGSSGSAASADGRSGTGTRGTAGRIKLLLLLSEAEPPAIPPSLLVSLVIECVFAIVSSLHRLMANASDELLPALETTGISLSASEIASRRSVTTKPTQSLMTAKEPLTDAQERCRGMLTDCWAHILSALALLLHGAVEEALLVQVLQRMQNLLFCCGRLGLDQARDSCLLQLSRYALPGLGHEMETEGGSGSIRSTTSACSLNPKNTICLKALLSFCSCFGGLLGSQGWVLVLRSFIGLERAMQKSHELATLRPSLDLLFEGTAALAEEALFDIIDAMGHLMSNVADSDEQLIIMSRLADIGSSNLERLLAVWDRILQIIVKRCLSEQRGDLRCVAAASLCRVLGHALKKGAVASTTDSEAAQEKLLGPLKVLLRAPHEDVRARICEGILAILQASGQELHPAAWGTTIQLVATAARTELKRAGLDFDCLPKGIDVLCLPNEGDEVQGDSASSVTPAPSDGKDSSSVLPTVFQLLELLVHDFMEYIPADSVPHLTASIGAFARFTGLGVNSSLTAVGFLWNVADALARYHCDRLFPSDGSQQESPRPERKMQSPTASRESSCSSFEELWIHIFMHLRVLAVDGRPEVRNCAVKSLTSALLSHGKKVGTVCYKRCLHHILFEVLAEIQEAASNASAQEGTLNAAGTAGALVVHHSRDTQEKQWDETAVLGMEGVRRVLSHFAEEAGVTAFAPLAYMLLLQIHTMLRTSRPEVAGSSLRALVDLMRIPAASEIFAIKGTLTSEAVLPLDDESTTSIWLQGWEVLWGMVQFCMVRDVPESLMETFASTLNTLRNSHQQSFSPAQHVILLQLAMVLITMPSFYLPSSTPLRFQTSEGQDIQEHKHHLAMSAIGCKGECSNHAVFEFANRSPDLLWKVDARTEKSQLHTYTKKPSDLSCMVDTNQSKNVDIRSVRATLQQIQREGTPIDDAVQAFLGAGRSPTHRTMLHISSSRLQHVQGFVFGLLEETQGFPDPLLEVFFICQCCAVFLDVNRILLDTNKVALAARTLCLLVLFFRRVLLQHLACITSTRSRESSTLASRANNVADPFGENAAALAHVEALIGAMPHVCHVLTVLCCCHDDSQLRVAGLWKLASEALLYILEDSLPAVELGCVSKDTAASYWKAMLGSLSSVVCRGLTHAGRAPDPGTLLVEPAVAAMSPDVELLAQAVGNLLVYRILTSGSPPTDVAEQALRLLDDLVLLQSGTPGVCSKSGPKQLATTTVTLGHLFDLCNSIDADSGECKQDMDVCEESIAALSSRGSPMPRLGASTISRELLLKVALPSLMEHIRKILIAFIQEEERGITSRSRATQVRFVLAHLKELRINKEAAQLVAPPGERAHAACALAGPWGCAMIVLPQLGALAAASDTQVRQEVCAVIQGLAGELGLRGCPS